MKTSKSSAVKSVALQGLDYLGVRPKFLVKLGETVSLGQTLFVDRKREDVRFVAPASGVITSIEFAHKRMLDIVSIHLKGDEAISFEMPSSFTRKNIQEFLLNSGMWPAFTTRPYGKIPDPFSEPEAIFVTAMDASSLSADVDQIISQNFEFFQSGLELLEYLTDGNVFVCHSPKHDLSKITKGRIKTASFPNRHLSSLASTHINRLYRANEKRTVWHIAYQEIIALGGLRATKKYWPQRDIIITGSGVKNPIKKRTRFGANISDLLADEIVGNDLQVISGSLLSGRRAKFLGRFHTQICIMEHRSNAPRQQFFKRLMGVISKSGSGAIIPISALERAIGIDIFPIPLMRALSIGDVDSAKQLGCLELIEEDVALLSYMCASKNNYGNLLRKTLDELELREK